MTNPRLNGLALLFIRRQIDLDVSETIDLFAQKNRRIQMRFLRSKGCNNSQNLEKDLRNSC